MEYYTKPQTISAYQAKFEAFKLSFAPIMFQVSYCLLKLGILEQVSQQGEHGVDAETLAKSLNLSVYGVKLLLDVGLSCHLVWKKDDHYVLDKTGMFLLADSMIKTHFDFIQDVCYQGLFNLIDAIKSGKPEGLKVFGNWETIYQGLSQLPPQAKESWFNFDHYHSDAAFPDVLPIVFAKPVKLLVDIGGNTGKWALQCLAYSPDVHITLIDLPQQILLANEKIGAQGFSDRFTSYVADMLGNEVKLPAGSYDVIWMSQFLDCFSESEILKILRNIVKLMSKDTKLYILELFWDRQAFETAAFSINCTSIYFTALANGNSRMYHSKDLIKLLHQAELYVDEDIDGIGTGHTLLGCKRKP
ncbi:MAG: class I SAM-dependent methyltransferase [Legionellales bacterium]|nr:class I SAM-dependent methyltransferase [Legionellales bacterium]